MFTDGSRLEFTHYKSKEVYTLVDLIINATDDSVCVLYQNSQGQQFVRVAVDFFDSIPGYGPRFKLKEKKKETEKKETEKRETTEEVWFRCDKCMTFRKTATDENRCQVCGNTVQCLVGDTHTCACGSVMVWDGDCGNEDCHRRYAYLTEL